ncbi:hypothetical protein BH10ACT11_BH10ACT11_03980 [soil metagenome]
MLFTELLRVTVFLVGAVATVLGFVSMIAVQQDTATVALIVAGAWWAIAAVIGYIGGRGSRPADAVSRPLASARTATSLPVDTANKIALMRLWPIGVFAVLCGGVAWVLPQVAVIGTGYAILTALAWRGRESAVEAIENRDGVRFYVEATSALEPVRLVRTPGLYRDRPPSSKPPPPPPAVDA